MQMAEGTVRALAQGLSGSLENVTVTGPLGTPVDCEYAIWEKRNIGGSGRIDFVGKEMMAVSENASVVENTYNRKVNVATRMKKVRKDCHYRNGCSWDHFGSTPNF